MDYLGRDLLACMNLPENTVVRLSAYLRLCNVYTTNAVHKKVAKFTRERLIRMDGKSKAYLLTEAGKMLLNQLNNIEKRQKA